MSRADHLVLLAILCACGKVAGGDAGRGVVPDGAGSACVVDAGALALALQSPPACAWPDPDGGSNAGCQQWVDGLVGGAKSSCNGGLCASGLGNGCLAADQCTVGSQGHSVCKCGPTPWCGVNGQLCLNVGGHAHVRRHV